MKLQTVEIVQLSSRAEMVSTKADGR